LEQSMREQLLPILEGHRGHRESLIPVLQKVQGELGYLPEEAVSEIAHFLGLSRSEIFGVASFYAQFRFERQGEHIVKVCQGTACHVRGAKRILEAIIQELGVEPGGTTEDYKFSLERVACFGSCALAPVLVIDGQVYGRMTTSSARKVLEEY
jgi:NADH:ubiquinone oxidoreductase subunit E